MKFLPALMVLLLAACSPSDVGSNATATAGSPTAALSTSTSTTAITTSALPAKTVESIPPRDMTYPYFADNIKVQCKQDYPGEPFTYIASAKKLGTGTFSFGELGKAKPQDIGSDGYIDDNVPVLRGVNVDTIVQLVISATNYNKRPELQRL